MHLHLPVLAISGGTWILLGVAAVLLAGVVGIYNGLVGARNRVKNAWSQIDVQLKRRYDLIPNLVETVKGYAAHERETLEAVIQARQQCVDASGVGNQASAENFLTQTLGKLFALSEAYPDLKANTNFGQLQEELTSTENRIGFARQHYNNTAENYNTGIQKFPAVMVARTLGFREAEFFQIEDPAARHVPKVSFS